MFDISHNYWLPIRIGIGFHSGPLIMGIIGDARRMDAASIADTVNTASRMESLTKHYGVNILLSEDSLSKIPDSSLFHFRFLGRFVVKGKKKALGLYECFDGDEPSPSLREKKRMTAYRFREAVDHYFRKEFGPAVILFRRLVEEFPEDRVVARYLQQTEQLLRDGVSDDWTGVEWLEWKLEDSFFWTISIASELAICKLQRKIAIGIFVVFSPTSPDNQNLFYSSMINQS